MIDNIWEKTIKTRKQSDELIERLEFCSEIIYAGITSNSEYDKKQQIINKLVRISSEVKNFRRTADVISNSAREFIDKNGKENRNNNIVVPKDLKKKLRHEHLVPCEVMAKCLLSLENPTPEKIKEILLENGIRCIITVEEDNKLKKQNLNACMPKDWSLGDNPFLRYKGAGINDCDIKPENIIP